MSRPRATRAAWQFLRGHGGGTKNGPIARSIGAAARWTAAVIGIVFLCFWCDILAHIFWLHVDSFGGLVCIQAHPHWSWPTLNVRVSPHVPYLDWPGAAWGEDLFGPCLYVSGSLVCGVCLGMLGGLKYVQWRRSVRRASAAGSRCRVCGYDNTGTVSVHCPECGAMRALSPVATRRYLPRWAYGPVCACLVLTCAVSSCSLSVGGIHCSSHNGYGSLSLRAPCELHLRAQLVRGSGFVWWYFSVASWDGGRGISFPSWVFAMAASVAFVAYSEARRSWRQWRRARLGGAEAAQARALPGGRSGGRREVGESRT